MDNTKPGDRPGFLFWIRPTALERLDPKTLDTQDAISREPMREDPKQMLEVNALYVLDTRIDRWIRDEPRRPAH